ncbi:MAG TPA: nicotinate-nucleotide adenylyltransferase [Bacteroidota bacterium]|nr:nicotinate-nucleotide adenylyltransferase [Bacteroidota bacterium]
MRKKITRIGIFGGSFDPPHLGHIVIAELARRQLGLERVFLVPAFKPPHKAGRYASTARDRLHMTKLSIRGNRNLRVSDIEIRRRGISYTVDTVRFFKKKYHSASLFLIIGGDSLRQFKTWREPDVILSLCELVVYRRPGAGTRVSSVRGFPIHYVEGPSMDVSSSEIRARLKSGKPVEDMLRKGVLQYIRRNELYVPEHEK